MTELIKLFSLEECNKLSSLIAEGNRKSQGCVKILSCNSCLYKSIIKWGISYCLLGGFILYDDSDSVCDSFINKGWVVK